MEVDNEVLSTTSEGAAGPGATVAETEGEVDTTEPELQGEVLAEEGGVPIFDSAISGSEESGSSGTDASEETDVSGDTGGDVPTPAPTSPWQ